VSQHTLDVTSLTPPLMNLNIPNLPLERIVSVEITNLSTRSLLDRYEITLSEPNMLRMKPLDGVSAPCVEPISDMCAVERGCLSLTPLQLFPDIVCVAPWGYGEPAERRVLDDGAWLRTQSVG